MCQCIVAILNSINDQLLLAQVVGNIIRIDEGEELPCDVVILSSSLPNGEAYITTANLDGETNLKVGFADVADIANADWLWKCSRLICVFLPRV